MSSTTVTPGKTRSVFRGFLIVRALPALATAVVITFSANHAVVVGQVVFLVFGFVMAPIVMWVAFSASFTPRVRLMYLFNAVAAVVAAAVTAITIDGGLGVFTLTVGLWAALTGLFEIYAGLISTEKDQSREMLLLGGITAIFGVVEAVVPLNDVYAVGLFGAYGAILGVFALIAGFSSESSADRRNRKKAD